MEESDGSPPQSLNAPAAELYPKLQMEKEDPDLTLPFLELTGEYGKYVGRTDDGIMALSNYRIFVLKTSNKSETSVPLGLIESIYSPELFHLIINCKDASTVKCSFDTAEQCSEWQRRIQLSIGVPESLDTLFAFAFCRWTRDARKNNCSAALQNGGNTFDMERLRCDTPCYEEDFAREVDRLGFDLSSSWRISSANEDFKLCPSYPKKLLVPSCITDEKLLTVANFRGSRRLPAVVWRHSKSGAVIARSSQPEVGWFGCRSFIDEELLQALADACAFDRGECSLSSPDSSHEEVQLTQTKKMLIVDARSYTSAVTNRARGGGCERIEYYPCAEIEFMNLGNIHVIRRSFQALRQLCASPPDNPNWLGLLEKTMWLQHLSALLTASMTVCHAIEKNERPVLVHCSDGWDRTPQIVATALLCLDPFYRTVDGFRILVEREWISYGHKFADRCGHGPGSDDVNERCPVFLQWLDMVFQIHKQFSCSFEFSLGYLIKLAQHAHSCLFGTFLCNTLKERIEYSVQYTSSNRTFSVWPFLSDPMYKNPLYYVKEKVLWPAHNVRNLYLWTDVYFGSLGNQSCKDFPSCNLDGLQETMNPMIKTRSYGDLVTASITQNGISRRLSDPNMNIDSNSEHNSFLDFKTENETISDIDNFIHDTTKKVENLTLVLNNHDKDNFSDLYSKQKKPYNKSIVNSKDLKQELQHNEVPLEDKQKKLLENASMNIINNLYFLSSPNIKTNLNKVGCEINSASFTPENAIDSTEHETIFNTINTTDNPTYIKAVQHCDLNGLLNSCINNEHNGKEFLETDEVMIEVDLTDNLNEERRSCSKEFSNEDPTLFKKSESGEIKLLGDSSITTSIDTIVPTENIEQKYLNCDLNVKFDGHDITDGECGLYTEKLASSYNGTVSKNDLQCAKEIIINNSTNCSILPEVHNNKRLTTSTYAKSPNNSYASHSSTSSSISKPASDVNTNNINNDNNNDLKMQNTNNVYSRSTAIPSQLTTNNDLVSAQVSRMDDSIAILPEHSKLDILLSGKCETISSSPSKSTSQNDDATINESNVAEMPLFITYSSYSSTSMQRRRNTLSINSRRDGTFARQENGSFLSRYSLPGVRSLPMTPPGCQTQIPLTCPDGLAHALSEQNIRLQQIVQKHKKREEELSRKIENMQMELSKKMCPNCSNGSVTNDEQSSTVDNVENASVGSWETVDERSGPASSTSSCVQPNDSSCRWVPDYMVSHCTSCKIKFWQFTRKHHCRACGQIFCNDCSAFSAPLPEKKLFDPVRLCGPCYHAVTTAHMQQHQRSYIGTALSSNHDVGCSLPTNLLLTTSAEPVLQHQAHNFISTTTPITPTTTKIATATKLTTGKATVTLNHFDASISLGNETCSNEHDYGTVATAVVNSKTTKNRTNVGNSVAAAPFEACNQAAATNQQSQQCTNATTAAATN